MKVSREQHLKTLNILCRYFAILEKRDHFCDFRFALLYTRPLQKTSLHYRKKKEKNNSFILDPFSKGDTNNFKKLPAHDKIYNLQSEL